VVSFISTASLATLEENLSLTGMTSQFPVFLPCSLANHHTDYTPS